jgi:hypothetical protein
LRGAQIIVEAQDVRDVADRLAYLRQRRHVPLQQRVQQPRHVGGPLQRIHEEIVDASQERAPLEELAPAHYRYRAVGGRAQGERFVAKLLPEVRPAGRVPRALRERGPVHLAYRTPQGGVIVRVAVDIG